MKFSREEKKNPEINVTPLIDIVFILLIFLMVSTSFNFTNSIDVNLPAAKGDEKPLVENIRIVMTKEGLITVNDQTVQIAEVEGILGEFKKTAPAATVIIEADKEVAHGQVVTVMDASRKAGYEKFAIAVEEE
ncbi:ExbD/TolR family protein [Seleniivibrio woodruffii]|uniref:Outer membrane transport energization protein ExbD n=1 Tax=Seleniivibrio woodruffii TaxID=1078050 RepID=A0A4R1K853_9BACT|nr:biopolymer transporter ExbD [Seleniivibrio woodruffii]TCK60454.1 outer membrane transport energization protein ExbD [Seleniivibrio woodruffii]TVZ36082.1 biopolymer transport protein ExbD [Seleniivibrio woodruffii]